MSFVGIDSLNGGRGRCANATGNSQLEGTASIVTNRGFFNTKGSIAY